MADFDLHAPLVCGIDYSDHSRRALGWALFLAGKLGTRVQVVTALDPLLNEAANREYGEGRFQGDARRDLETLVREVSGGAMDVEIEAIVGDPAEVLIECARRVKASMLVVGTQGLGRAGRVIFGSTTWRLLRTSPVAVLAVPPPQDEQGAGGPSGFDQIVCGVDFCDESIAAAHAAVCIGSALAVPVTLIHAAGRAAVPQVWSMFATSAGDAREREADSKLRELATSFGEAPPAFRVEPGGAATVLQDAAASASTLLVLGLGSADGKKPGSTAINILAQSSAPVLAVPRGGS